MGAPAVGNLCLESLPLIEPLCGKMTRGIDDVRETIHEGIPASPGIAIAPVQVVARGFSPPEVYVIQESEVAHESERFLQSLEVTKRQLI